MKKKLLTLFALVACFALALGGIACKDEKPDKSTSESSSTVESAHVHNYSSMTMEPTCTEQGYTTHTCACGDTYTDLYVDALGHEEQINDYKAPTCEEGGWDAYVTCPRCTYSTYQALSALGHDEQSHDGKPATCEEGGWDAYVTCSRCTYSTYRECSALGHEFSYVSNDDYTKTGTCIHTDCLERTTVEDVEAIEADFEFEEYLNGYTVKTYFGDKTEVVIPASYQGKKIVGIGYEDKSGGFYYCDQVKKVTLPDTIKLIGYASFAYSGLEEMEIPASVVTIKGYAFAYTNLQEMVLPITIQSYGQNMFSSTPLKKLTCKELNGAIIYLLGENSRLEEFTFIKTRGFINYCFSGLKSLKQVNVLEYVESADSAIGEYAFQNCISLESIEIPNTILEIGDGAFQGCTSLKEVEILDSVTSIGKGVLIGAYAFQNCISLESIEIPNTILEIGDGAFQGCTSLKEVEIPDSVTSIGKGVLNGCSKLEGLKIPFVGDQIREATESGQYSFGCIFGTTSYDGAVATKQQSYSYYSTYYLPESLKSVTVTGGNILYGAFDNCNRIEKVILPNTLTNIGDKAFYNCTALTSVHLPNTLQSVGNFCFANTAIESINIPSSLSTFGEAWLLSSNLKKIRIEGAQNDTKFIGDYLNSKCEAKITGEENADFGDWFTIHRKDSNLIDIGYNYIPLRIDYTCTLNNINGFINGMATVNNVRKTIKVYANNKDCFTYLHTETDRKTESLDGSHTTYIYYHDVTYMTGSFYLCLDNLQEIEISEEANLDTNVLLGNLQNIRVTTY